jgi:hypothetical protein
LIGRKSFLSVGFLMSLLMAVMSAFPSSGQEELNKVSGSKWSNMQIATVGSQEGSETVVQIIGVGTPIIVDEADVLKQIFWGIEWLANPAKATARTKLRLYTIDDILANVEAVKEELGRSDIRAAFVGTRNDGNTLVAFPVLWDQNFQGALKRASTNENALKEYSYASGALLYNEVVKASARAEAERFLFESGVFDAGLNMSSNGDKNGQYEVGEFMQLSWDKGRELDAELNGKMPLGPFFAVDAEVTALKELGIEPVSEVLTVSDIYGIEFEAPAKGWPMDAQEMFSSDINK